METNVFFSPGENCVNHIIELIRSSINDLDICVFTISDDRITNALIEAKNNDVTIRIITDNDKVKDEGSDIKDLFYNGIDVKIDNTPNHMHHKFMIVDQKMVLTGSYNWTRSAAKYNQENIISIEDEYIASKFLNEFNRLWEVCEDFTD